MSDGTSIEWTDASWNPLRSRNGDTERVGWHCEHVSEGCRNCYAEAINRRLGTGLDYKPSYRSDVGVFLDEKALLLPLKWRKPRRIFVCSMTDLFADFVTDEMIDKVFAVMALAPQHTFQVLTKRSARMRAYITSRRRDTVYSEMAVIRGVEGDHDLRIDWPLPNVWLGISAEDQKTADERIPDLLQTPAAVRFLSAEPLLGPMNLRGWETYDHGCAGEPGEVIPRIDWVIVGGESGPHARPMHPDWARAIRDQCVAAGVPFFFKQWGHWALFADGDGIPDQRFAKRKDWMIVSRDGTVDLPDHRWPSKAEGQCAMLPVGKTAAGRRLDGRTWDQMPEGRAC